MLDPQPMWGALLLQQCPAPGVMVAQNDRHGRVSNEADVLHPPQVFLADVSHKNSSIAVEAFERLHVLLMPGSMYISYDCQPYTAYSSDTYHAALPWRAFSDKGNN